jgi:hypothetical protein
MAGMCVVLKAILMVNICLNNGGAVSNVQSMKKVSASAKSLRLSSAANAITLLLAFCPLSYKLATY